MRKAGQAEGAAFVTGLAPGEVRIRSASFWRDEGRSSIESKPALDNARRRNILGCASGVSYL